jgi:putative heme-binding domain-containing protein
MHALASLVVVGLAFAGFAAGQSERPYEQLCDGKTLAGWRGDAAIWRVDEAGAIVGSSVGKPIDANTFLVLDGREPANFEFETWVELSGDNNSGVQYRSRVLPGEGFRVAGYQCDVHTEPKYLAMLYDEQGAGIIAERGQCVLWRDDGKRVLGAIHRPAPVDLSTAVKLRIVAMGDVVWHELAGVPVTAVIDERAAAPRSGVLALQVHNGAPMTVRFRHPSLREWPDLAAMQRAVPVPPAVQALRTAAAAKTTGTRGAVPRWLWDASPQDGEELFFRRAFPLPVLPKDAQIVISCDNHCRVYVNGDKLGESDEWESPLEIDVTKALRVGDNVVAVHAWNDGGPAALAARVSWQVDGNDHELVSDATWQCSDDDPDGWSLATFDAKAWPLATVLGAMGDAKLPWTSTHGVDAFGGHSDPLAAQVATVATGVAFVDPATAPVDPVLRLLDVPRSLGSWVSLGADSKGRLYASAQSGGLYRVNPAQALGGLTTIERVPVKLGGAHGLLWFRDALYAVVNGKDSGLYRLTDADGDDMLDRAELLQALEGAGEHGPHSVVVAPDGAHLLVVAGNQTKLPKLASSRVPTNWAEDRLLPRLDDPNPYWEGISPPGGWVCQCDADGKNWELLCCGFRNPYDVAQVGGDLVVFDSDMEWDLGLPWYRPTRLLVVQSGVDYGWRIGSAKWPADYPDAPPAWRDIGPSSPTGMASDLAGTFALDWTFGTVYLDGKPWLVGAPFPLTDIAIHGHKTWLATGGRGLPSALYLVPWDKQREATESAELVSSRLVRPSTEWRDADSRAVAQVLGEATADPAHRVAARLSLERSPVEKWRDHVLAVDAAQPTRSLTGLLALARQGAPADLQPILDALGKLSFASMAHDDRIAWLRVHALAMLRQGPPNDAQRAAIAQRLLPLFPTNNERQDQDLAELLVFVDAPGLLDKLVPALSPMRPSPVPDWAKVGKQGDVYGSQYAGVIDAMANAMPPIGQIAIADALRTVKHGWTLDQRRTFFTFLGEARKRKGGASYSGFLKKMIDASWATCSPAEQQALAELVGKARADAPKFVATPPKGPGRDWQPGDIDAALRDGLPATAEELARGHNLFHAASCAGCHYFAGEGGNHGPDLTSLGNKFGARDVLEAILEPSKVVSEQYAGQVLTKQDGSSLFGFAVKGHHGDVEVWEVMPAVADAAVVRVPVADVAKVERSPLSPMPADLADRLSRDELRALLAFLLSRGQGAAK